MTFQDSQLQQCYDANLAKVGSALGDLGPAYALITTHNWFAMLEGAHSARVHETLDRLLSTEMRPALRDWYGRSGLQMDSIAVEFRDQLNHWQESSSKAHQIFPLTHPERVSIQAFVK